MPRFLIALVCAVLTSACTTLTQLPPGQVATRQGIVAGSSEDGITSWRGIEYARAGRWQSPGPGPVWEGVKPSGEFGPACPQSGQAVMVENCLFLNVFAPEAATSQARLPVVVWIHGGGFRAGSGGNGPRLWAKDGMVVVTFNYRLGILGFHDWLGWSETDPRNFGQADMVAALEWVQANIAGFGGDPRKVTIYGHSAGGMGVQLMMVDPRARGLFARAISDAGYGAWPFPSAANPSPEMRMRIRYGPLETDASVQTLVARTPHFHLPYLGGSDLSAQPSVLFEQGRQARVPFITGFNSYDGGGTLAGAGFTPESFLALFSDPAAVRAAYASDFAVSDLQGAERAFGDRRYGVSNRQIAASASASGAPAWLFYYDAFQSPQAGAGHGAHYQGSEGLFSAQASPMKAYFQSFVRSGRPAPAGQPDWRPYRGANGQWMVFAPAPRLETGVLQSRLDALEKLPLNLP